jgi:hypothetical protein
MVLFFGPLTERALLLSNVRSGRRQVERAAAYSSAPVRPPPASNLRSIPGGA